jgi:acyl-CoA-binding protein
VRSGGVRLGSPPQEDLLRLYSLFKQGTQGDCKVPRPSMLDMAGAVKWDAWNHILGMPIQTAQASYVVLVQELSSATGDGSDGDAQAEEAAANMGFGGFGGGGLKGGLEAGGDWYDDEPAGSGGTGAKTGETGEGGGTALWALARDGEALEIDKALAASNSAVGGVDSADDAGRTALYWAADRGHATVICCLIKHGADLNVRGEDGQTALHCAIVCEYEDVVELLLEAGANTILENEDGESALALAKEMLGEESAIAQRVAAAAKSSSHSK